jgi:hypothetical protein
MFGAKKVRILTVTVSVAAAEETWILQGRLIWPWVNQLREDWRTARRVADTRTCFVNLSGVTSVDKIGERMLRIMANQGAQFVASSEVAKRVLEKLQPSPDHRRAPHEATCAITRGAVWTR